MIFLPEKKSTTMADLSYGDMEISEEVGEASNGYYNSYGESQDQAMDIDDIPVSQEDAWAVIS